MGISLIILWNRVDWVNIEYNKAELGMRIYQLGPLDNVETHLPHDLVYPA